MSMNNKLTTLEKRFAELLLDTIGDLPPREAIEKLMFAGLIDIRACERQAICNEVRRAEKRESPLRSARKNRRGVLLLLRKGA